MNKFINWLIEAKMPESMKLSPEHEKELASLREKARIAHNKAKISAKKRGKDFPEAPYEDSWAYEMDFRRKKANTNEANLLTSIIRRVKGEEIPKNFRPDQHDAYEKLRASGVGHEEAIKAVQDTPVYHRLSNSKYDKLRQDVESRWGR
jgi:hypothetical protein